LGNIHSKMDFLDKPFYIYKICFSTTTETMESINVSSKEGMLATDIYKVS
jgi:hypothetical protein